MPELVSGVSDPMKADQSKNELRDPALPEYFLWGVLILSGQKPKRHVAKNQRPGREGDVTCSYQNTCQNGPAKFLGFMLEKLNRSLHHAISNTNVEQIHGILGMNVKLRCPACAKLYEVQKEDIHSDIPVFQCVSCHSKFAFEVPQTDHHHGLVETFLVTPRVESAPTFNDALSQFNQMPQVEPVSVVEPAFQAEATRNCPKCGAVNGRKAQECYSCHVIFSRLEGLPQDPSLKAQPSLVRKWKNLLENFDNEALHEEFIMSCQALDALRFATMKYEEIRDAQGGDALCDQMLARIQSLMMVELQQKPLTKNAEAQVQGFQKYRKYMFWAPFVISGLMILLGMLNLGQRNLIGLGVAIACMASGLIVMVRGRFQASDFFE